VPPFSGKLSETCLAQVFSRVLAGGRSGGVKISQGTTVRQFFIEGGTAIRYAASTLMTESITDHLKQRGAFQADQMRKATTAKQSNELLTSTLLRLGFLSAEDHRSLLAEMIEKILLGAARWSDARFEFHEGELPFSQPEDTGVLVPVAILGLVRNATEARFLRAVLGDGSSRVRPSPSPPVSLEKVALQPAEGFLMSRSDGTLSLHEVAVMSPLGVDETERALCGLILSGFLKVDAVEGETALPKSPGFSASDSEAPGDRPPSPRPQQRAPSASPSSRMPSGPVDEMLERHSALPGQNLYQVLGLTSSATESEVRHNYYSLAKRLHPDKFSDEETKTRAEKLFASITEAYATLSKAESRAEYDKTIAAASEKPSAESTAASAAEMARQNFRHGRSLFEKHEMVKALSFFEHAVEQDETKEEYHRFLALVQSRNPRLRKEAERHLLRAIELNPTSAESYAQLGLLYRKMGMEEKGIQYLQQAISWDSGNATARAALDSGEERKGILKNLFRK
jgi:tetratricopeptide (TPR) repeat protein